MRAKHPYDAVNNIADADVVEEDGWEAFDGDPESTQIEARDSGLVNAEGEKVNDKGLYAKTDLPNNAVFYYDGATALAMSRHNFAAAERLIEQTKNPHTKAMLDWFQRYGVGCQAPGGAFYTYMSTGSMWPFVNHDCNTSNFAINNEGGWGDYSADFASYTPVNYRHKQLSCTTVELKRALKKGEAITDDYADYFDGTEEDSKTWRAEVAGWCKGKTPKGSRTIY